MQSPPVLPSNILRLMSPEDRRKYAKGQFTPEETCERIAAGEEKLLHKQFLNWLLRHEIDYRHSRMDKRTRDQVGMPDFHVWRGTRHCFVEMKSDGGRLRPEQEAFLARQARRGTPVLVTNSYKDACNFVIETLGLDLLELGRPLVEVFAAEEQKL